MQRTAYDVRISDWSSYVCSSELAGRARGRAGGDDLRAAVRGDDGAGDGAADGHRGRPGDGVLGCRHRHHQHRPGAGRYRRPRRYLRAAAGCREMDPVPRDAARQAGAADRPGDAEPRILAAVTGRSEEHTSELQSLMRISYAVFCLKKKKTIYHTDNQ